jgi:hypothetical protein
VEKKNEPNPVTIEGGDYFAEWQHVYITRALTSILDIPADEKMLNAYIPFDANPVITGDGSLLIDLCVRTAKRSKG